ncbi:MAG: sortase B protein-sorting domain-containing protein [Clostridia bacterium]|nr:sortase B protein-sorting domain-containing protein [Clostridia bacterium]
MTGTGNSDNTNNTTSSTKPNKPTEFKSPQTGDSSMMALWIALLFVSGAGITVVTIYKLRKSILQNNA